MRPSENNYLFLRHFWFYVESNASSGPLCDQYTHIKQQKTSCGCSVRNIGTFDYNFILRICLFCINICWNVDEYDEKVKKKFAWTTNATEYLILLAKLGIQSKLSQVSWLNKGWTVFCPTGCPNTWIFQAAFGTWTRDILLKNVYRQAQMARVQANHIISYHIQTSLNLASDNITAKSKVAYLFELGL